MKRKRGKSLESVEISLEVCLTRAVALGTEPELTNGILAERTAGWTLSTPLLTLQTPGGHQWGVTHLKAGSQGHPLLRSIWSASCAQSSGRNGSEAVGGSQHSQAQRCFGKLAIDVLSSFGCLSGRLSVSHGQALPARMLITFTPSILVVESSCR